MRKILLVEDDVLIGRIYRRKLEDAGFHVLVAEDGVAAIKLVRESKPELVVLDLIIPKLSGSDVLKFIRQDDELKATPVVVFSNAFMTRSWEHIAAMGVQESLSKSSASPPRLIEVISRLLDKPGTPSSTPATAAATEPAAVIAPAPAPEKIAGPAKRPTVAPAASPHAVRESRPVQRSESAAQFRSRIRRDFFEQIPAISKSFQVLSKGFLECPDPQLQLLRLGDLQRKIGFLTHMTSMAGCYRIAQLASAFEALLFELQFKPSSITDSVRQTIASTSDLLADSLTRANQPDEQCLSPTTVLVVDDDAVSSRSLGINLARASLTATSVADAFQALEKLKQNSYDVALLDINLPGMSGISLCQEMRKLPLHANTPVIFITSFAEFEPRARAILTGGDDLIAKPIMPVELTVKIVAHLLKRRLLAYPSPG